MGGHVDPHAINHVLLNRRRQGTIFLAQHIMCRDVSVCEIAQPGGKGGSRLREQFGHILFRDGLADVVVERLPGLVPWGDHYDVVLCRLTMVLELPFWSG